MPYPVHEKIHKLIKKQKMTKEALKLKKKTKTPNQL